MKTRILLILLTMLLCGFANAQEVFTSVEQLMNHKREADFPSTASPAAW